MTQTSGFEPGVWFRSITYLLLSTIVTCVFLLSYPLVMASRRYRWAVVKRFISVNILLLRWICDIRVVVTGAENLPGESCILASRHESMWETLFLPWYFNNPVVLLKSDILNYPIAGRLARSLGHVGVDRTGDLAAAKQMFEAVKAQAKNDRSVLIFPSGTRDPEHRDRVQTGVAVLYRMLDRPCVPILLDSGKCWVYRSFLRRPGVIEVRILPAIPAGLSGRDFAFRLGRDLSGDLIPPPDQA